MYRHDVFSCLSAELDLTGPDAFLGWARDLDTNTRFFLLLYVVLLCLGLGLVWFGLARYFLEWNEI